MRRIYKLHKLQSRTFLLCQPPLVITWITEGSRDNLKKISILFLHLQFCCVMSSEAAVIKPYLIFRRGLQDLSELQTINSLTSNMVSRCKCGKYVSTNKNDSGFICLFQKRQVWLSGRHSNCWRQDKTRRHAVMGKEREGWKKYDIQMKQWLRQTSGSYRAVSRRLYVSGVECKNFLIRWLWTSRCYHSVCSEWLSFVLAATCS